MRNTKHTGDIAVAIIAARLLQAEYAVLVPMGDNQPYDLVIEKEGIFKRIQCKNGRITKNGRAIKFSTCSVYSHKPGVFVKKDYTGRADYFGVYVPILDKVFLVPVEICGKREGWLKLNACYSNGGRMAKDFELRYGELAESG